MSTRRAPLTIEERLAILEEWMRRLQGDTAVSPTDTRFLYSAKGEILVAAGPADPVPLAVGSPGDVLTVDASGDPGWVDPDRVQPSLISVPGSLFVGTGSGIYAVLVPGPNGTVLAADSTSPLGVAWV